MANGIKLPPVIIFKLAKIPWREFSDDIIIYANPKGWMNEDKMVWWIENIWTKCARQRSNLKSLLILDSFTVKDGQPVLELLVFSVLRLKRLDWKDQKDHSL